MSSMSSGRTIFPTTRKSKGRTSRKLFSQPSTLVLALFCECSESVEPSGFFRIGFPLSVLAGDLRHHELCCRYKVSLYLLTTQRGESTTANVQTIGNLDISLPYHQVGQGKE